jgi:hypothetical protein
MTQEQPITPRHPRWLIERRTQRLVEDRLGTRWGRGHTALYERLIGLWQHGGLHERDMEAWLQGRIRLR